MKEIITGVRVQCLANLAELAFAWKSKTFRSLYSHALLILNHLSPKIKWYMSRSLKIS